MHEVAGAQRQRLVVGRAVEIDRAVAGLEDDGAGDDLALVADEEQLAAAARGVRSAISAGTVS